MKVNILKCSYNVMPVSIITKAKELNYICISEICLVVDLNTSFSASVTTMSLTDFTDQEVITIIFMLSKWNNS
jgi:hypothetical protein